MNNNLIFVICGKSNSGKDTIMKNIMSIFEFSKFNLHKLPIHTTRPIRLGEKNGVEYVFDTDSKYNEYLSQNKICEERSYKVNNDKVWHYYTLTDDIEDGKNYITINTLDGIRKFSEYFSSDNNKKNPRNICAIYIDCPDVELLTRAMNREIKSHNSDYKEMCRRFIADTEDFSIKNLDAVSHLKNCKLNVIGYDESDIPISFRIIFTILSEIQGKNKNTHTNKEFREVPPEYAGLFSKITTNVNNDNVKVIDAGDQSNVKKLVETSIYANKEIGMIDSDSCGEDVRAAKSDIDESETHIDIDANLKYFNCEQEKFAKW